MPKSYTHHSNNSSSSTGSGINLPADYFVCPVLTHRERQFLIQKAHESATALVDSARSVEGPIKWSDAGFHRGVQMFKGAPRKLRMTSSTNHHDQVQYGCGVTTIRASLDEIATFMDLSTTEKMKTFAACNADLLDGVVLYSLVEPSIQNPLHQITVKWTCAEMPSALIKNRDFLTLECQKEFTDATGRRGWVRAYHSIQLPCCPDQQATLGLVRGSFYHTGYVFVESERPGYVDVIFTVQVNLKGNLKLPPALHFIGLKRRIGAIADLTKMIQERRLEQTTFLQDYELVDKSLRSRCHLCAVKFGLWTRKTRCRKCGEVVCHSCAQEWSVAGKQVRVCRHCNLVTERDALEALSSGSSASDRECDWTGSTRDRHPTYLKDEKARYRRHEELHQPRPPRYLSPPPPPLRQPPQQPMYTHELDIHYVSPPAYHQDVRHHDVPTFNSAPPRLGEDRPVRRHRLKMRASGSGMMRMTDETATSSSSDRSLSDELTAHALVRHTRQAGPTGPVTRQPHLYPSPRRQYPVHERSIETTATTWKQDVEDDGVPQRHRPVLVDTLAQRLEYHPPPAYNDDDDDDDDHREMISFDASSLYSPLSKCVADNFSAMLREDEPARASMDPYLFSVASTLHDYNTTTRGDHDDRVTHIDRETTSVVQLYQQILDMTKQQHALDLRPDAPLHEKEHVARELHALYQRLNYLTLDPESEP